VITRINHMLATWRASSPRRDRLLEPDHTGGTYLVISSRKFVCAALPFVIAAGAALPASAMARPAISTDSAVYVEHLEPDNDRRLEPASRLSRGDRVVTVVTWYRMGGNGNFMIVNPMPRAVAYQNSATDGQEVSVDGGRTWGHLGTLRIGDRLATPEDVTHVRWRIASTQATQGRFAYSGIVR